VPDTDPAAAVQTLVKNGYGTADGKVDCAKLGEIKLTFGSTAQNRPRFEFLAANLQKVFGCAPVLDPIDPTAYTAATKDVSNRRSDAMDGWVIR
jgi:oligopeptide transport system substrate-binding protein